MPASSELYTWKQMGYQFGDDCEMMNRDGKEYQGTLALEHRKWCEKDKECVVTEKLSCVGKDMTERHDYGKPIVSEILGSYLCVSDLATGIEYNESTMRWEPTNYSVDDLKWIVTPTKPTSSRVTAYKYDVTRLGRSYPEHVCKEGFSEGGYLFCGSDSFRFNRLNGRFVMTSAFGYYNVQPAPGDTTDATSGDLALVIGKCSEF